VPVRIATTSPALREQLQRRSAAHHHIEHRRRHTRGSRQRLFLGRARTGLVFGLLQSGRYPLSRRRNEYMLVHHAGRWRNPSPRRHRVRRPGRLSLHTMRSRTRDEIARFFPGKSPSSEVRSELRATRITFMKSGSLAILISITALACGSSSSSSTSDAGYDAAVAPTTDTCSANHNCLCTAGSTCAFTCSGSDACNATCDNGSICSLVCGSGACTLDCQEDSSCKQTCGSGTCLSTGEAAASLEQTCSSGMCNLQCTDVGNCEQTTGSGAHNCSGCTD
jgi:hypothetical protein